MIATNAANQFNLLQKEREILIATLTITVHWHKVLCLLDVQFQDTVPFQRDKRTDIMGVL